jgi:hypothetical protein
MSPRDLNREESRSIDDQHDLKGLETGFNQAINNDRGRHHQNSRGGKNTGVFVKEQ